MAHPQSLQVFDVETQRTPVIRRHNVIPFPSPRVQLPVTLPGECEQDARSQLKALLHSPLGVYVVSTEVIRDQAQVEFDIAPDDLDFTLHTLIATLPHAMIGALKRRSLSRESR